MDHHLQTIAHCARSLLLSSAEDRRQAIVRQGCEHVISVTRGPQAGDGERGETALPAPPRHSLDTLRPPRTSCSLWTASADDASSVSNETGGVSASRDELDALSPPSAIV